MLQPLCGNQGFWLIDIVGGKEDLPLKVAQMHSIVIRQHQRADTCTGKVHRCRGAEAAKADNQHPAGKQLLLADNGNIFQQDLAAVAHKIAIIHRPPPQVSATVPWPAASLRPG
ncbi:glycerol-3-phosphate dehydrogenase [NAD+ ] [Enterobacter sp. FY-07]|nr:glycerol-3-phosphate dehydrogenase [NAD+ ] [Enterobacter sp. FY-07]